jgi:hypothetical protein
MRLSFPRYKQHEVGLVFEAYPLYGLCLWPEKWLTIVIFRNIRLAYLLGELW